MPKLWKRANNTEGNTGIQEVNLSTLAISSPTTIFISGRETTDDNPVEISKSIHFMEKIFRGQEVESPPQIYSWSHSGFLSTIFHFIAYDRSPRHHCRSSSKALAQGVIMPLVSSGGRPLPYDEAQKNLRNLTFFGYCVGSIVAQEVFNASMKMMKKIGYQPEEARALLHEVALVTIGTVSCPNKEQDRFTTIYLANSDDWFVRIKKILHPLRSIFSRSGRKLKIKPLSDTSLLVSGAASGRMVDRLKIFKEKIEGVELPRWRTSANNHEARDYVNSNDNRSQVSRIVPCALVNALNRDTSVSPVQLLQPLPLMDTKESSFYQNRINKALVRPK